NVGGLRGRRGGRRYDCPDRDGLFRRTADSSRTIGGAMPGVWKKTLNYLGLVEDEEYDDFETPRPEELREPARVGARPARSEPMAVQPARDEAVVRTIPQALPTPATTSHRAEPPMFNDARELGLRFRDGSP